MFHPLYMYINPFTHLVTMTSIRKVLHTHSRRDDATYPPYSTKENKNFIHWQKKKKETTKYLQIYKHDGVCETISAYIYKYIHGSKAFLDMVCCCVVISLNILFLFFSRLLILKTWTSYDEYIRRIYSKDNFAHVCTILNIHHHRLRFFEILERRNVWWFI